VAEDKTTESVAPEKAEDAIDDSATPAGDRRPSRRPARRTEPVAKDATPPWERKAGPIAFVGQSVDELRKVTWPSRNAMGAYFVAVLIFVVFIMALVSPLDTGLGWLVLKAFGQ